MLISLVRVILVYVTIVFGLRLMGKRQIGQLAPSELVVTILASNVATMAIEDQNVPLLAGTVPILTLVSFDVLISILTLKSKRARRIISGSPRVIISDGKINQKELADLRYSVDDLMAQLRQNQIFDIKDVAFAIVETTGNLSLYEKKTAQTVTCEDLSLPVKESDNAPPMVLISDGSVIDSALVYCNLSYEWLNKTVTQHHLHTNEIFLMTCDRTASYIIVPRDDKEKRKAHHQTKPSGLG